MNTLPTAEEFYKQSTGCVINHRDIKTAMIEFAKLHVEAALKEAGYAAVTKEMSSHSINEMYRERIKQSYPLENIK